MSSSRDGTNPEPNYCFYVSFFLVNLKQKAIRTQHVVEEVGDTLLNSKTSSSRLTWKTKYQSEGGGDKALTLSSRRAQKHQDPEWGCPADLPQSAHNTQESLSQSRRCQNIFGGC